MSTLKTTPWTRADMSAYDREEARGLEDDLTVHIGRSEGFRCRILRATA